MGNILIAENDVWLGRQIAELLRAQQHTCRVVTTVDKLLTQMSAEQPELVIMDRLLDDGDSLAVLDRLRSDQPSTRFLILSQLSHSRERVAGLERGAHDYLAKPFNATELLLRTRRLLELSVNPQRRKLSVAQWQLDLESGEVSQGSTQITRLRKKEAELVACLMRWSPQIVSRDRLIDEVWGDQTEPPLYSTLDVYVRRIRVKLKSCPIQTARGFGYRWLSGAESGADSRVL